MKENCRIAIEACEIYYDKCTKGSWEIVDTGKPSRHPVLVAASVGSCGAYLADGSEYSGNCGDAVTLEALKDFHRERVQILANSVAHLIAYETTPNKLEAKAYAELLEEEALDIPAWFTFASKVGISVVSGDSIFECASIANVWKQVVVVGIYCTLP
ncbi:putative homocysteine S-methyltransferase [Rosa chinensis]|uniref:Putative homocysteine S-methyltransferase n=1 Tax=Rosa chinensis TaxID=74649 RepID=A0A2P6QPI8_ROSCH|nr:putative homocysteine S-methyltransferase [Rosa chinensis]